MRDVQDGHCDSSVGQLFSSVAPIMLPLIGLSILWVVGVGIVFTLLIIPGLYLLTIWAVAVQALVIERQGVLASFGRSRELVRAHRWQVFGVILIVGGLDIAAGITADIIASGLGDTRTLVQWVLYVFVSPFTALMGAILYFSLRRVHGECVQGGTS